MNTTNCVDDILKCRGIRQGWLAGELGISDAYLSMLLAGQRPWTDKLKSETARLIMVPRKVLFFEYGCGEIPQAASEEAT